MTHESRATAFRTIGDNHIPINVPCYPGIDEEMIAREDTRRTIAQAQVSERRYNSSVMTTVQAALKKAELKRASVEAVCNPDICHCVSGKQHCHLNMHDANNGRLITRGRVHYCATC